MRPEYDFSKVPKNPHAKRLKKPITIRLDEAQHDGTASHQQEVPNQ